MKKILKIKYNFIFFVKKIKIKNNCFRKNNWWKKMLKEKIKIKKIIHEIKIKTIFL